MTERKTRAKSPSKVGQGPAPNKKPRNNYFATLMSTPEGRELRRQWSTKPRKNPGRPKGVPDGYRKADIEPIREQAKKEAEKEDEDDEDDDMDDEDEDDEKKEL